MLYPHSELKMKKMCIIIIFLKYALKYILTLSAGPLGRAALWIKFKIILIFDSLNTSAVFLELIFVCTFFRILFHCEHPYKLFINVS